MNPPMRWTRERHRALHGTSCWLVVCGTLLFNPRFGVADDNPGNADADVRAGVAAYAAEDFATAVAAFERALELAPDDARVQYDLGCALKASGEIERSIELLKTAAQSSDPVLAAKAHFNLGGAYAETAQQALGEDPVSLDAQQREPTVATLMQAVSHYRTALELDPQRDDARRNLELLRLWIKQMRELWRQHDLDNQPDESSTETLIRLLTENRDHRRVLIGLESETAGMSRHQQLMQLMQEEHDWNERVGRLHAQLEKEWGELDPTQIDPLLQLVEQAGSHSKKISDSIAAKNLVEAMSTSEVVDAALRQLLSSLGGVVEQAEFALEQQTATRGWRLESSPADSEVESSTGTPFVDRERVFEQGQIGRTIAALLQRAPVELQALQQQRPDPPDDGQLPIPQQQALERYRGILERAIAASDELQRLNSQAVTELESAQFAAAAVSQDKIAERLREILAAPSDEPQSGDSESQDQSHDDSEQSDSNDESTTSDQTSDTKSQGSQASEPSEPRDASDEQSPQPSTDTPEDSDSDRGDERDRSTQPDEEPSESPQPQPTPTERDSSEAEKSDDRDDADPSGSDEIPAGESSGKLTRSQAEGLLQKVRERERYRRELEKQIRKLLRSGQSTRRDW